MGQIIDQDWLSVDPEKIVVIQEWPCANPLKLLCGVLGLIGYYMKFVKKYGKISSPLTTLLKKNVVAWNKGVEQAFSILKQSIYTTLVLVVFDFINTFVRWYYNAIPLKNAWV